jgi:hypothetical protein
MTDSKIRQLLWAFRDEVRPSSGIVAIRRERIPDAAKGEVERWIRAHGGEHQTDDYESRAAGGGPATTDRWLIRQSELVDEP